jgi:superfamily II DNA helicase RecQ
MLAYGPNESCRRQYLLSLLNAESDSCGGGPEAAVETALPGSAASESRLAARTGCDICDGSAVRAPREEKTLIEFIKKNPRRFTPAEAALILSGDVNHRSLSGGYAGIRGFGALGAWEENSVAEALETLVRQGKLRIGKNFFFKGKLGFK